MVGGHKGDSVAGYASEFGDIQASIVASVLNPPHCRGKSTRGAPRIVVYRNLSFINSSRVKRKVKTSSAPRGIFCKNLVFLNSPPVIRRVRTSGAPRDVMF